MDDRLPTPEELGDDFKKFCEDNVSDEEAFFSEKAEEIINTISDEKYIQILTLAGIEEAEGEAEYKDADTLASSLCMVYALSDADKSPEEFYEELMRE